ncbi:MAG: NADH-quinone oxidoreductase subunit NuoE [Armatimonadota bacterium]
MATHEHMPISELLTKYPRRRCAILPALHAAQAKHRHLSDEAIAEVAEQLELTTTEVTAVASFYHMLHLEPVGQYVIDVCTSMPCGLLGGEELVEHLQGKLGIELGETTPDGKFTLRECECLGACDGGPVVHINDREHRDLTPERLDAILKELGHSGGEGTGEANG